MQVLRCTGNHGISGGTGKGMAHAAGADYAHYCACKNGHQDCRAGRKGQEPV